MLNGYAEFIRDVLVCQNPKAASLLEVVEGMQTKYTDTAKSVSPAYLIGALNILNEAEINYRMARNKRLHVEMTMIKLSFLQQAIELSFDNKTASVVKKKRISGPIAIRYEPLQSLQIKPSSASQNGKLKPATSKLYIEQERDASNFVLNEPSLKTEVSKDGILTTAQPLAPKQLIKPKPAITGKKSLLDTLRQQMDNSAAEGETQSIVLSAETLQNHWLLFAERLKSEGKNSHVTVFNNARLEVVNNHHFCVTVSASLEQKFIEQEKVELLEYLKSCFKSRNIAFNIVIEEQERIVVNTGSNMTARDKYLKTIEKYPLIKELKDRLKLDLD